MPEAVGINPIDCPPTTPENRAKIKAWIDAKPYLDLPMRYLLYCLEVIKIDEERISNANEEIDRLREERNG